MEVDLVHAFFGRFGILIPLLGLFFETAVIITQKDMLAKLSGAIVILGSCLAIIAGVTGFIELNYLKSMQEDISPYHIHIILGTVLTIIFIFILLTRTYLLFKNNQTLVVIYMLVYVVTVMVNLFSNEIVVHKLYGA